MLIERYNMKKYSLILSLLVSCLISMQAMGMLKRCAYVLAKKSQHISMQKSNIKPHDYNTLTLDDLGKCYTTNPECFKKIFSKKKYNNRVKTILNNEFKRCNELKIFPGSIVHAMYDLLYPSGEYEFHVNNNQLRTDYRKNYCYSDCEKTCKDGCTEDPDRNEGG